MVLRIGLKGTNPPKRTNTSNRPAWANWAGLGDLGRRWGYDPRCPFAPGRLLPPWAEKALRPKRAVWAECPQLSVCGLGVRNVRSATNDRSIPRCPNRPNQANGARCPKAAVCAVWPVAPNCALCVECPNQGEMYPTTVVCAVCRSSRTDLQDRSAHNDRSQQNVTLMTECTIGEQKYRSSGSGQESPACTVRTLEAV